MKFSKTFLKTCTYAIMHMTLAILVAYILSGSWAVALAIGLIEPCVQTVAFFFHEKAWHKFGNIVPERSAHDHHNSIIDSVSPVSKSVDRRLQR